MNIFSKNVAGLKKTKDSMMRKLEALMNSFTKIDEDFFEELEELLITCDIGVETSLEICGELRKKVKEKGLTETAQLMDELKEIITEMLGEDTSVDLSAKPAVILVIGVNGAGKTTTIGKLAARYKNEGKSVLVAAADTFRAAAIDQLEVWTQRAGVDIVKHAEGSDPAAVVFDAVTAAKARGIDVLIFDTAGRLHIDEELMDELKTIKSETAPNEIMLMVDAMTGQDAVNVAKAFDDALGIDSVLMSKLDSDTRGGAALSVLAVTGKPIRFVGTGEKLGDFEQFHPERMASRILGMGDMLTLIERAQSTFDEENSKKLSARLKENSFDITDLMEQMKQIQKMGPLKQIIGMLPGVGDKIKDADIDDSQLKRIEAIILSMTPAERAKPSIIDPKRKRRIAAGSGNTVADVNRLLRQFEEMQKMMKQFGVLGKNGKGKKNKLRMPPMGGMPPMM